MTFLPATVVAAPEPLGLRYGLLTAAAGPLELPEHAAAGGVTYEPVSCGSARLYDTDCPTGRTPTPKVYDTGDELVSAASIVIYATYQCGAAGHTGQQMQDKLLRRLANGEQSAAERALGVQLAAAVTADGTVLLAPDPTSITSVVGELEQWLYGGGAGEAGYGNIGYLHVPFRLSAYLDPVVFRDGAFWRTRVGTRVVIGDYPDGEIYISGHVTVWRSPEVMLPPAEQVLDRTTNQWRGLAEREYAIAWDCHAAVAAFDYGAVS